MEKKKIRSAGKIPVSLIGVGGYGAKLTDIIKRIQYLEIVSCYHPDRDRSCEVASKIGCKPALNEKEAMCDNGVEAVIIASPDPSHFHYIYYIYTFRNMKSLLLRILQYYKISKGNKQNKRKGKKKVRKGVRYKVGPIIIQE
mgnify:CR=1 FL=1